jgi:hypothetical protein
MKDPKHHSAARSDQKPAHQASTAPKVALGEAATSGEMSRTAARHPAHGCSHKHAGRAR